MNQIYERLSNACKQNGTSITAVCLEITGSKGNLATWKKGKISAEDLATIKIKFNISIDNILVNEQPELMANNQQNSTPVDNENVSTILKNNGGMDYIEKLYKELDIKQKVFVLTWLVGFAKSNGIKIQI